MADEPSNFALQIADWLQEGETFELSEEERAKLTEYERHVLARTAIKCEMISRFDLESGKVFYSKRIDY